MVLPIISPDSEFLLMAALLSLVSLAIWIEKSPWGRKISAALVILVGGAVLSNLGVIPKSAPLYTTMNNFFVPVAIPMFLLRADVRKSIRESGRILLIFLAAAMGTIVGALLAYQIIDLGADGARLTGVLTASYIGGGVNFVAVAQALELQDSSEYVAALSADTVCSVMYLAILVAIPSIAVFRRMLPKTAGSPADDSASSTSETEPDNRADEFDLFGATNGLAISLVICAIGWWFSVVSGTGYGGFIVAITSVALIVANFGQRIMRFVNSEFGIGMLLIYLFFGSLGASADLALVLEAALPIFVFLLIVLSVHLSVVLMVGRIGRFGLDEVVVASNACILGPTTAAAMAAGFRWTNLVTPGMLVGVLGYSFATFVGLTIASFL